MATQTHAGIDMRLQIVGLGRFAEEIDGYIPGSMPRLVLQPTGDAGPDMARHTLHLFMG
jgi:hypothetical protein